MLTTGITGGIGSGKSVICHVFASLGIPVFNADDAARLLMEHDEALIENITALLGEDVYTSGKLNREKVSAIIFHEPEKLKRLNALVHPATISYSLAWRDRQHSPYVIKESALFFESGSAGAIDVMIGVYAPDEVRIKRTMSRSVLSREKVLSIMRQQMDEDEKMKQCDFVIINDDISPILPQALTLHQILLEKAQG